MRFKPNPNSPSIEEKHIVAMLRGDALWSYLTGKEHELPTSVQAKLKEARASSQRQAEVNSPEQREARRKLRLAKRGEAPTAKAPSTDVWTPTSVALPVFSYECAACGSHATASNGPLLLKSTHPTQGAHYVALRPGEYSPELISHLPRVRLEHFERVAECPRCFDLEPLMLAAAEGLQSCV